MKMLITLCCLLFLTGCKKDDEKTGLQEITGKWELRKIEYGYSIQPVILFPSGNGNVISFSGGNQYSRTDITNNDTVATSGSYRISHSITCNSRMVSVIDFSGGYVSNGSIIEMDNDSLYFRSDSCAMADGVERTYIRVN